jgi:3-ketosteroid 9alpha-monooxygenase subunit A
MEVDTTAANEKWAVEVQENLQEQENLKQAEQKESAEQSS